jgi:hypothetical protein
VTNVVGVLFLELQEGKFLIVERFNGFTNSQIPNFVLCPHPRLS